ncbi:MAG: hypothetical protein RLZZ297_511 [Chloroflexota bacterium]|jgi:hypothetical protein
MSEQHFFIAGAQRSGTTYAYHLCAGHPDIEMALPVRPEPKFFLDPARVAHGYARYRQTYFGHKPGATHLGEKSTSYIEVEAAARAIATMIPTAKIIFVLRDPIERAISNYQFSALHGVETVSIRDAFYHEAERVENYDHRRFSVSPYAYLRRGRYIEYLELYERYFPAEHIHVMIYEQMVAGSEATRSLYDFLGVDRSYESPTRGEIINASGEQNAVSIDDELRAYLRAGFAPYTERLRAHTGLAIAEWDS